MKHRVTFYGATSYSDFRIRYSRLCDSREQAEELFADEPAAYRVDRWEPETGAWVLLYVRDQWTPE